MKNSNLQSRGDLFQRDLDEPDPLSVLLQEYAEEYTKQPDFDSEWVTEVITGIQKLNKILEGINLPANKNFMTDWVTAEQVKVKLGISERTLFNWRKFGKLPFARIVNKFYYKSQDIEKLLVAGGFNKNKKVKNP